MSVDQWLEAVPPLLVYGIVYAVIMTESFGIPLPGEIVLVSAAVLASQHHAFGRFVALLRILAGPIAGSLRMHYPRFFAANALGGIVWAGGTTALVYYVGVVANDWLKRLSWAGLAIAVIMGLVVALVMKRRLAHHDENLEPERAAPALN